MSVPKLTSLPTIMEIGVVKPIRTAMIRNYRWTVNAANIQRTKNARLENPEKNAKTTQVVRKIV